MPLSRRAFLARSAALGCSAAASPLLTPLSFAAGPWENRLVVIILRGGMDGLDVVRPYGDPAWAALRGPADPAAPDLDGHFALHPALAPLMPLWRRGELGFAHAVSTPYRDKRSHFDGQDLLEAGTPGLDGTRDGWLNRLLQAGHVTDPEVAYSIGREEMKVLDGPARHAAWTPEVDLLLSPQARDLARYVMEDDPAFAAALGDALALAEADGDAVVSEAGGDGMMEMAAATQASGKRGGHVAVAEFAAARLAAEARIAAFSLNGWDTHQAQARTIAPALTRLSELILALRSGLGPAWGRTAVLAMTEFGRTARLNGTGGTDHGTGGLMLMAGGALKGGRVVTEWPGLASSALYAGRDLMPTRDVRAHAAWAMAGLFGFDRSVLEGTVFPGLDMGADPGLLL